MVSTLAPPQKKLHKLHIRKKYTDIYENLPLLY